MSTRPADFIVGIPSNRPERLKPCLLNVFDALQAEGIQADVFVCDGSGHARQNQEFAMQAAARYGIQVTVQDEKSHQAKQSPDTQFLFDGPFGGPRNAILQHAVKKRADTVFLDDDVVPSEQLFSRFKKHLNQHKIVVGAYAGKRTAAVFLMDKVQHALTEFAEGRMDKQDAARSAREAFCGLSDDWPPSVEGYAGGCMGVALQSAQTYAFYPSHFRMEDGMYCILSKHYVGQDAFLPFLPEAPVGVHKPHAGPVTTLVNYYRNALQGACVGKSVKYALEHYGQEPDDVQMAESCLQGPKDLLEQFEPEMTASRRQQQKPFDEAIAALGEADLQREYDRFIHTGLADVALPGLHRFVKRFFDVQKTWRTLNEKETN